jgi:DNA-binding NarL/FixJ family response regulator
VLFIAKAAIHLSHKIGFIHASVLALSAYPTVTITYNRALINLKILIIDDHALFREGLRYVLEKLQDFVLIIEAANFDEAIQQLSTNNDIDLVLLDLQLPGKDGFLLLERCGKDYPSTPIAVLSASTDRSDMKRVMATAAMGYIPKDTTGEVMLGAVKFMLAGGLYIPPVMAREEQSTDLPSVDLTPRQLQVLSMIGEGVPNKLIASELGIAEATIKMHITAILKTLGVSNRTQAAIAAKEMGLILN